MVVFLSRVLSFLVSKSCLILATPWTVACQGPPSMGILQARILEWVASSFSRGSSWPRNWTRVSSTEGRFFTNWVTREAPDSIKTCLTLTEFPHFLWWFLREYTYNMTMYMHSLQCFRRKYLNEQAGLLKKYIYKTIQLKGSKFHQHNGSSEEAVCVLRCSVMVDSCRPVDRSQPGSSVHGVVQARTLEWLPLPPPGDLHNSGTDLIIQK